MGHLNSTCPLAEVWVTTLTGAGGAIAGEQSLSELAEAQEAASVVQSSRTAASARPRARYTDTFRYSNGEEPFFFRNGGRAPRTVVETYGATVSFNQDLCWYLDSTFCSHFHELKKLADPSTALLIGRILIWLPWSIFVAAILWQFVLVWRRARRVPRAERVVHIFEDLATWSMLLTTLRLVGVLAPPIFYGTIFLPCWECYDFEGAAAHEIGHVLGLSHPDRAPPVTSGLPGQNLLHQQLAAGIRFDGDSCLQPWEGVRVDGSIDGSGQTRPTIMKSFSQHTPRVCIEQDDLEALHTLYPDCTTGLVAPVCYKTVQNIGWVRLAVYIMLPTLAGLALIVGVGHYCQRRQLRKLRQAKAEAHTRNQQIFQFSQTIDGLQRANLDLHASITEMSVSEAERVEGKARALTKKILEIHHADSSPSDIGSSHRRTEGSLAGGVVEGGLSPGGQPGSPRSIAGGSLLYLQRLAASLPFSPRSPRSRRQSHAQSDRDGQADQASPRSRVGDQAAIARARAPSPNIANDPYFDSSRVSAAVEDEPRPAHPRRGTSSEMASPGIVPWGTTTAPHDPHAATTSLIEVRIGRVGGTPAPTTDAPLAGRRGAGLSMSFS